VGQRSDSFVPGRCRRWHAVLWVPYLLLRKSPRRWWLYTGLLMVPFSSSSCLVQPVWIDPLFNRFGR
jgi:hypothetical protein